MRVTGQLWFLLNSGIIKTAYKSSVPWGGGEGVVSNF